MNLKALAYKLRKDTVDIICSGKAGHIGGDMSVMESTYRTVFLPDENRSGKSGG